MKKLIFFVFTGLFCFPVIAQNTTPESAAFQQYQVALQLFRNEQYAAARQGFEKFLTRFPHDYLAPDAEYYRAFSAISRGQNDGEVLLNQFIQEHPANPKATLAYYELGNFYFQKGNYEEAVDYYEKVDLKDLSNDERMAANFQKGYGYLVQEDYDQALTYFNEVKSGQSPYFFDASYYAGYIAYQQGNYNDAIADLSLAEKSDKYRNRTPPIMAKSYMQLKQYQRALDYATQYVNNEEIEQKEDLHLVLAESHYFLGDYQQAIPHYESYQELTEGGLPASIQYHQAYAYYANNQEGEAIDLFKNVALVEDTIGRYASYYLGNLYLKQNNPQFALFAYEKAVTSSIGEIAEESAYKIGKIKYDLGQYAESIASLQSFVQAYPQSPLVGAANDLISQAFLNVDDYELAIQYIEGLDSKSPAVKQTYQKVTFYRGAQLFNDSKFYPAIQYFQKSLTYPLDGQLELSAHFWSAEAWSIGKKWSEAIGAYERALNHTQINNSTYTDQARYGLAYAYYNSSDYPRSLDQFQTFIRGYRGNQQDPRYQDAVVRSADLYFATKLYDRALKSYEEALSLGNPDRDYIFYQMGVVRGFQQQPAVAKEFFDRVINDYPNSSYVDDALFQKGQEDLEESNFEVSIRSFEQLIDEHPQSPLVPFALVKRGVCHFNLGDYVKATSDYGEVIKSYPRHAMAKSALLGLQETAGVTGDNLDQYLALYREANPEDSSLESIEFETAKGKYFNQLYGEAITAFNKFLSTYAATSFKPEALFYIADSYYRQGDYQKALEYFYQVLDYPIATRYNRSVKRIADIEFERGKYVTSIQFYRRLLEIASNRRETYDGREGLMDAYLKTDQLDSAAYFANLILGESQLSANARSKASLTLGKIAFMQEDYEEAQDQLLITLNTAKDEFGAEANYLIALMHYQQEDYRKSIEVLYGMNRDFSIYDDWLGKSFLLIADNYIALEELFQAKATLNSIVENSPVEEVVDQAKARLRELEELEKEVIIQDTDTITKP